MNKDKSLLIYGGIFFGIFLLISIVLAFSVYSGKSSQQNVQSDESNNITSAQTQPENNIPSQMPEVTPTPTPTDFNNLNTPSPVNSSVPTDNSLQQNQSAQPEVSGSANLENTQQAQSSASDKGYFEIGADQNEVLAKQIQVCFASYIAEHDNIPAFNNIVSFRDILITNCSLQKDSVENIENISIIDPSVNYKINLTFKDGKTYENTPKGFTAIN